MTIEKLIYTNEKGEKIEFSPNSLYHSNIAKITGLSDVKNTLYTTSAMGQDGSTVTGNKIQPRHIVISGAIKSTNKDRVLELKRVLSRVLNPHLQAKLTYEYGDHRRVIDCRLETAPVFKRGDALLTYTIDVTCAYPFWAEEVESETSIAGWLGCFEFNQTAGGWEIVAGGVEMGQRTRDVVVSVTNNGDIATGIRVEFTAGVSVTNPSLTNITTGEYMAFTGLTMQAGDKLVVTTAYGEKACKLYRGDTIINALAYWDTNGKFLQLETGENLFRYSASTNADGLEVKIYATNLYLGV